MAFCHRCRWAIMALVVCNQPMPHGGAHSNGHGLWGGASARSGRGRQDRQNENKHGRPSMSDDVRFWTSTAGDGGKDPAEHAPTPLLHPSRTCSARKLQLRRIGRAWPPTCVEQ